MKMPEDEVKAGAPDWVVTFGDMMSLLLTFFVLLLSFSSMEPTKFKMIAGYMREAFGVQSQLNYSGIPMGTTLLSTDARDTTEAADQMNLIVQIRKEIEESGMAPRSGVEVTERGVAVRLEGEAIFESGETGLKPEALSLVDGLADLAAQRAGTIEIEGHSDNVPISSSRYPSNWELSSARAASAARYMISRGVPPSRIRAVGYADTRPLAPNDTPENRAQNRRVEFLFVREPDSSPATPSGGSPRNP
jgi:chemotaxis protein MotB